jgi:hypothetical protein
MVNLNCPSCGSPETQKLTLALDKGGVLEKGAKVGVFYFANIWVPFITFLVAVMFAIMFAFIHWTLAFAAFVGVCFLGYLVRKWVKNKGRSKFDSLSAPMKQAGFQCNRCAHMFIPA